jgi:hypothetical protein
MTWDPYGSLTVDQHQALGELTWAAMRLEGVIDRVCETLHSGSTVGGNVTQHVNRASTDPSKTGPAQLRAREWARKGLERLDLRNKIIHSSTRAVWRDVNGELVRDIDQLVNVRKGKEFSSPFDAEHWRWIAEQIDEHYEGWRKVDLDLVTDWKIFGECPTET